MAKTSEEILRENRKFKRALKHIKAQADMTAFDANELLANITQIVNKALTNG